MTPLHFKIIIGSTRPNRFGDKPAHWIFEEVKKLDGIEAELLDLRDYQLPFFDQPMPPSMVKDGNYGHDVVNAWAKKIGEADAYVIVSPEYNHGPSGVLKNALDSIYGEWNNKTVGFVSYGSVGGARAVEQLRQTAVELQMAPIRNAIHIPGSVMSPIASGKAQWNAETEAGLHDHATKMLTQLVWWAKALKAARSQT